MGSGEDLHQGFDEVGRICKGDLVRRGGLRGWEDLRDEFDEVGRIGEVGRICARRWMRLVGWRRGFGEPGVVKGLGGFAQ